MKKNFLITTGGSGGHVTPATILYSHLSGETNVILSTDKRGLKYLDKNIYQIEIINTPKLNNIFFLPINIIRILYLTLKSFFLLKDRKIEKVFSTGGYMSLPIILAARFLKLHIYLVEPNQILGRANKYFLNSCKKIFCYTNNVKNFPDIFKNKMIVINPLVKKQIYKLRLSSKPKDKFTLLVVGGSQGANIFDNDLKNSIVNISKTTPLKMIHQTSEKNIISLNNYYLKNNIENKTFSFDKNFTDHMHQADLCITRAGASTLAELSLMNIPFIAVPLPTAKDNHQLENANFYKDNNCCWIIQQNIFEEEIEVFLKDILGNDNDYLQKKRKFKKIKLPKYLD